MFVYRSIALGLLGACCLLLAMRPPITVISHAPGQILVASSRAAAVPLQACVAPGSTIVDVASGVTASQLAGLLRLLPDEHVVAIDNTPVTGTLDAGVALASVELRPGRYLDVSVKSDWSERRVLVLLH